MESIEIGVVSVPPRHWWLKRILLGVTLLLALLTGLRLWWGMVAHRRLEAEIERYRAAGQPVALADFDPPGSAGKVTAAALLIKAAESLSPGVAQSRLIMDIGPDLVGVAQDAEQVAQLIEANRPALRLLRQARSAPRGAWEVRPESFGTPPPPTLAVGQVRLSRLIGLAAAHEHLAGNDAEVVELMHDHCVLSTIIARTPFLLSDVMPGGSRPYASGTIEVLTPRLTVRSRSTDHASAQRAAERERVEELIEELLNEAPMRDQFRGYMFGERALEIDAIQAHVDGRSGSPDYTAYLIPSATGSTLKRLMSFPLHPMMELDAIALIRHCTETAEAGAAPNWPAYLRQCPSDATERVSALARFSRPMTRMLAPSFTGAARAFFRALTSRRLAGTALAIRLYEVDQGRRPEALTDLVPNYLPAAPLDPFADPDHPIVYKPGGNPPILYSVGIDARDDGGVWPARGQNQNAGDIIFYLNGDRPRFGGLRRRPLSVPSTQAGENNQNVEDDKRNERKDTQGERRP